MITTIQRVIRSGSGLLVTLLVCSGLASAVEPPMMMSKAEVKELVSSATTAQDHHRLAAYFTQKADFMEAEAVEHEELGKEYAKHPGFAASKHTMSDKTAGHCQYFATAARKAAVEDRSIAAAHEAMAKAATK